MLLTGRYNHRCGIPDYIPYGNPVHVDNGLPAGTPTVASVLQRLGYRTGLVGKWHLGYGEKYHPQKYGFDIAEGYRHIAPGKRFEHTGQIPYLLAGNVVQRFGKSAKVDADCTTILADRAIDFIRSSGDRAVFLFLSFNRPHLRWEPVPKQDLAHYAEQPLTVPDLTRPPSRTS